MSEQNTYNGRVTQLMCNTIYTVFVSCKPSFEEALASLLRRLKWYSGWHNVRAGCCFGGAEIQMCRHKPASGGHLSPVVVILGRIWRPHMLGVITKILCEALQDTRQRLLISLGTCPDNSTSRNIMLGDVSFEHVFPREGFLADWARVWSVVCLWSQMALQVTAIAEGFIATLTTKRFIEIKYLKTEN